MSAKQVALFFTWRAFGAGTTTFTAHLAKGLLAAGIEPIILRPKARSEAFTRPFAHYTGLRYRNVSSAEALKIARQMPSLLTAPCPAKHLADPEIIHKLAKTGMQATIHGLLDMRVHQKLGTLHLFSNIYVVRSMLRDHIKHANYIPHPYVRVFDKLPDLVGRKYHAVSIARITFIKNTHLICAANELLEKRVRIKLLGTEDRMYTRHKLQEAFPNFKQGGTGFPPSWDGGARACANAQFAVDMSDGASNGGGGTQYTFLEAWDAGAINVINADWLQHRGSMLRNINCYAAATSRNLADIVSIRRPDLELKIIMNGRKALEMHDATKVARYYWDGLKRS